MKPSVSIIMGSTSDMPVMEKACKFLNDMRIPFEVNALSAHRTPQAVEQFAKEAKGRGIKVIIAGAGMAAALPGVIAAMTTLPVIGVPIKGMLDGLDAMLSIIQMLSLIHISGLVGSEMCIRDSCKCGGNVRHRTSFRHTDVRSEVRTPQAYTSPEASLYTHAPFPASPLRQDNRASCPGWHTHAAHPILTEAAHMCV